MGPLKTEDMKCYLAAMTSYIETSHSIRDDHVASFQLENSSVRGRICRLGDFSVDAILKRHDYPRWAAHALGEAMALAVLSAATLKIDGKILVQIEGNGPIGMMAAEAHTNGALRGYLRINKDKWEKMSAQAAEERPSVQAMIGKGVMGLIIIQDNPGTQPYQGVVPLDGETIAECAAHYFAQSEQIPTQLRLSVGEIEEPGGTRLWRVGGAIIQQVAGDDARGDTKEEWDHASALFDTLSDMELVDPAITSDRLLYRLFHENGVRMEMPKAIRDECTCSEERLKSTLSSMPRGELKMMAEEDGKLVADCQFCGRIYHLHLDDL